MVTRNRPFTSLGAKDIDRNMAAYNQTSYLTPVGGKNSSAWLFTDREIPHRCVLQLLG